MNHLFQLQKFPQAPACESRADRRRKPLRIRCRADAEAGMSARSVPSRLLSFLLPACLCLLLAACATVPYSGRSRLLLTSEAAEIELGENAWRELLQHERIDPNPKYNAALQRVGTNIAAVVGKPQYKWEFKLFASEVANAFCLPGGKVGVYTGLFDFAANDAELAAVIGHEIAHAVARHGGERMSHGIFYELGAATVGATTKGNPAWQQIYGITAATAMILPYSRAHEYEADYLGLLFMAKAGYDPNAAVAFWQKFGRGGSSERITQYLSTHPAGEYRIREINKHLPEALELYRNAPVARGLGEIYSK